MKGHHSLVEHLGGYLRLQLTTAHAICSSKNYVLLPMLLTPFDSILEALVTLIRTCHKHIEINFLDNLVNIRIGDDLIHIPYGFNHIFALYTSTIAVFPGFLRNDSFRFFVTTLNILSAPTSQSQIGCEW